MPPLFCAGLRSADRRAAWAGMPTRRSTRSTVFTEAELTLQCIVRRRGDMTLPVSAASAPSSVVARRRSLAVFIVEAAIRTSDWRCVSETITCGPG